MDVLVFTVTPFAENCIVLKDGDEAIIIDPGEAVPELFEAIEGCKVPMLVNTHCHIDHVGGNAAVIKKTGAELVCHKDAAEMLAHVPAQGQMFGMTVEPSPPPDRFIDEGDKVAFGSVEFDVVYVPGHAPGHIALVGEGYVIGGDVLFAGSIGRTDLPGGSHEELMTSIKTKFMTLPDDTVVLSGHGPSTTIGAERIMNPFLVGNV